MHVVLLCGFESGLQRLNVVRLHNKRKMTVCVLETRQVLLVRLSAAVTESGCTIAVMHVSTPNAQKVERQENKGESYARSAIKASLQHNDCASTPLVHSTRIGHQLGVCVGKPGRELHSFAAAVHSEHSGVRIAAFARESDVLHKLLVESVLGERRRHDVRHALRCSHGFFEEFRVVAESKHACIHR